MSNEYIENVAVFSSGLYRHAQAFKKSGTGLIYFSNPERIPYEDREDTIIHTCRGGEFLWEICQEYYLSVVPNPIDMMEIVANFQPAPLQDWTVPLRRGQVLLIPSNDFIEEVPFGDSLMDEQDL